MKIENTVIRVFEVRTEQRSARRRSTATCVQNDQCTSKGSLVPTTLVVRCSTSRVHDSHECDANRSLLSTASSSLPDFSKVWLATPRRLGKGGSVAHGPGVSRQGPSGSPEASSLSELFTWRSSKPSSSRRAKSLPMAVMVCFVFVTSSWMARTRPEDSNRCAVPSAAASYPSTST